MMESVTPTIGDSTELIVKPPTKVYRKKNNCKNSENKSTILTKKDFHISTHSTFNRGFVFEPIIAQTNTVSDIRTETVDEVIKKEPTEEDVSQFAVKEELVDQIYSSLDIFDIQTDTMEGILFKKPTEQDVSQFAVKEELVDHIYSSADMINIGNETMEEVVIKKETTGRQVRQLAVKEELVDHIYSSPDMINIYKDTTEGLLFEEPTEQDVSQLAVKEELIDNISSSSETEGAVKVEIDIKPTLIQPSDIQYMMRPCKQELAETSKTSQSDIPHSSAVKELHASGDKLSEKPYACSYCSKKYQSKFNLKCHEKKHTTADKPHKCNICNKTFFLKKDIMQHITNHHIDSIECETRPALQSKLFHDYRYCCNICNKYFKRHNYFQAHMINHTQSHSCSYCDREFKQEAALKQHLTKCRIANNLTIMLGGS